LPPCPLLLHSSGYGDSLDARDSINPIVQEVQHRFERHFDANAAGELDRGRRLGLDGRVHCSSAS
jgi:septin family protein